MQHLTSLSAFFGGAGNKAQTIFKIGKYFFEFAIEGFVVECQLTKGTDMEARLKKPLDIDGNNG
jgi:hypothetical protein